jgi:hypothetical protein
LPSFVAKHFYQPVEMELQRAFQLRKLFFLGIDSAEVMVVVLMPY